MNKLSLFQLFYLICTFVHQLNGQEISWNDASGTKWAFGCDFNNNDLTNVRVPGEECGPKCVETSGCTHFTWTSYNGGTCWMKYGTISISDAFNVQDQTFVCGIVPSGDTNPNPDFSGLNCIAYEPFSDPNYPGNVDRALRNTLLSVKNSGFTCIKTYYSQYYGLEIADYANQFDLKVVLGIRMGESFTEAEIQTAISSCKSFQNIIAIYAGNENIPNSASSNDVINIKNRVNSAGCNIPFGTVQTIGYFLYQADRNMVNHLDWLGYNVYPFFSNLGSGSPIDSLRAQIGQLQNAFGSQFSKFIITETGWPSAGGISSEGNQATIDNARNYANQFANMFCSREIKTSWISYFTFFDPIYKSNEAEYERNFGIADENGNPKWNIDNLHC